MSTGTGINTVRVGDEVRHITELDAETLTAEWVKLKNEKVIPRRSACSIMLITEQSLISQRNKG